MNNDIKRKRMRELPGKSKKLKLKKGARAAVCAGALTMAIMLASCGDASAEAPSVQGTQTSGTSDTEPGQSQVTEVTVSPSFSGTHTDVFEEDIPFDTVYIDDPEMYDDEEVVEVQGTPGKTQVTEYTVYLDGTVQSVYRESVTVSEPQSRVIRRGTKPSVTHEENTVTETLEKYSTIYEECGTMEIGTTKVKTEGQDSVTVKVYRYTYEKGELVKTEVISEQISERVDQVILVGTKQQSFGMPFIDAAHGGVNYKLTQSYGGANNHLGLDFAVYYGDPIVSVMDGTVIAAYDEGYFSKNNILWTYGTYVVIQHDNGFRTYYAHLRTRSVSVGDKVKKGQIIGTSGNTGRINTTLTGPYAGTHLHFEIRKYYPEKGVYHTVDPKLYLPWWK